MTWKYYRRVGVIAVYRVADETAEAQTFTDEWTTIPGEGLNLDQDTMTDPITEAQAEKLTEALRREV